VASTPERKVKEAVAAVLKANGVYYFFPPANGLGRAGIPDIIACCNGMFLAIECKAGKGTTTALQERELARIREAGGAALVVRENNINDIQPVINQLRKAHEPADAVTRSGPPRDSRPARKS
jgi:Holliday junction resolvase